jgi:hypothetical protein
MKENKEIRNELPSFLSLPLNAEEWSTAVPGLFIAGK